MPEYHRSELRRTDGKGKNNSPKLEQTAELREEREGFNIIVKSSDLQNSIQMAFSAYHLSTLNEVSSVVMA